jgi:hypothetical protein
MKKLSNQPMIFVGISEEIFMKKSWNLFTQMLPG